VGGDIRTRIADLIRRHTSSEEDPAVRTWDCGHAAATGIRRLCSHLIAEDPPEYFALLTGVGVNFDAA
jgi:hypothetical protein